MNTSRTPFEVSSRSRCAPAKYSRWRDLSSLLAAARRAVARAGEAASSAAAPTALERPRPRTAPCGASRPEPWSRRPRPIWPPVIPGSPSSNTSGHGCWRRAPRPSPQAWLEPSRWPAFRPPTPPGASVSRCGSMPTSGAGSDWPGSSWRARAWSPSRGDRIRRRGLLALACAGVGLAGRRLSGRGEVTPPPTGRSSSRPTRSPGSPHSPRPSRRSLAPEGAVVTVERTHDHYALIAGPEGRGWVPEGGVEIILPATAKRS